MVSASELIRGFAAVIATVAVIIGLFGLGTSITDQTAVLRSLLAATAGVIALAFLLAADRRRQTQPARSAGDIARATPGPRFAPRARPPNAGDVQPSRYSPKRMKRSTASELSSIQWLSWSSVACAQ